MTCYIRDINLKAIMNKMICSSDLEIMDSVVFYNL